MVPTDAGLIASMSGVIRNCMQKINAFKMKFILNYIRFAVKFNFLLIPEFVQSSLETVNGLCFDYNIW